MAILLWAIAAVFMSGCLTFTAPAKVTLDRPPDVGKLPLTVGIYYSVEFRAHEHVRTKDLGKFVVPSGEASVALFDDILPLMFENTVLVPGRPPLAQRDPRLVAVIEPRIEHFDVDLPVVIGTIRAEVTYRFTLYSPVGHPFASWRVNGVGEAGPMGGGYDKAVDLAMQDAARRFMIGFRAVPEVQRWLRQMEVSDGR